MTKKALLVSLFSFVACFAHAAPTPKDQLTVRQAVDLFTALKSLKDGGSKVVDGKESHVPFVLSGTVRWALSGNVTLLNDTADRFVAARDSIAAQVAGAQKKDDQAAQAKLNAEVEKELEPILSQGATTGKGEPIVVADLKKISLSDLQLDTNPIDVATLSALRLIISDQ